MPKQDKSQGSSADEKPVSFRLPRGAESWKIKLAAVSSLQTGAEETEPGTQEPRRRFLSKGTGLTSVSLCKSVSQAVRTPSRARTVSARHSVRNGNGEAAGPMAPGRPLDELDTSVVRRALEHNVVFQSLPAAAVELFASFFQQVALERGHALFLADDPMVGMFVVLSGHLTLSSGAHTDRSPSAEKSTGKKHLGPGDVDSLGWFVQHDPRGIAVSDDPPALHLQSALPASPCRVAFCGPQTVEKAVGAVLQQFQTVPFAFRFSIQEAVDLLISTLGSRAFTSLYGLGPAFDAAAHLVSEPLVTGTVICQGAERSRKIFYISSGACSVYLPRAGGAQSTGLRGKSPHGVAVAEIGPGGWHGVSSLDGVEPYTIVAKGEVYIAWMPVDPARLGDPLMGALTSRGGVFARHAPQQAAVADEALRCAESTHAVMAEATAEHRKEAVNLCAVARGLPRTCLEEVTLEVPPPPMDAVEASAGRVLPARGWAGSVLDPGKAFGAYALNCEVEAYRKAATDLQALEEYRAQVAEALEAGTASQLAGTERLKDASGPPKGWPLKMRLVLTCAREDAKAMLAYREVAIIGIEERPYIMGQKLMQPTTGALGIVRHSRKAGVVVVNVVKSTFSAGGIVALLSEGRRRNIGTPARVEFVGCPAYSHLRRSAETLVACGREELTFRDISLQQNQSVEWGVVLEFEVMSVGPLGVDLAGIEPRLARILDKADDVLPDCFAEQMHFVTPDGRAVSASVRSVALAPHKGPKPPADLSTNKFRAVIMRNLEVDDTPQSHTVIRRLLASKDKSMDATVAIVNSSWRARSNLEITEYVKENYYKRFAEDGAAPVSARAAIPRPPPRLEDTQGERGVQQASKQLRAAQRHTYAAAFKLSQGPQAAARRLFHSKPPTLRSSHHFTDLGTLTPAPGAFVVDPLTLGF
mmetsp:Transcript_7983/g.17400  ORF Transcript_7983/g.17400 Transcript_7983/m.17400 type:complete len:926 (+) Transcript_7983:39-2816(+)